MPTSSALQAALVAALTDMPDPKKNADNPAFKRNGKPMRYADLEATLDACKPVLAEHGIAVMQSPVSHDGGVGVHTVLIGHGETLDCGEFVLPLEGNTPQKAAGAITYARRYALTAIFGLAQEDDDANAASAPDRATEAQVAKVFALTEMLGMSETKLKAAIARDFDAKYPHAPKPLHPADLTKRDVSALIDKMTAAIEKAAPAFDPANPGPEIPFGPNEGEAA